MKLTAEQQQVVKTITGPVLVVAGPGSGKTATVVARVHYLVQQHQVKPVHILVISFTNKSAAEIKHRLADVHPWVGTFHALAWQILHTTKHLLLEHEQRIIVAQLIQQNPVWNISMRTALQTLTRERADRSRTPSALTKAYQAVLAEQSAIDFDEVLLQAVALLEHNADLRQHYQTLWQYVMVDEMQDTNPIQNELLGLFINQSANLCVIGDPDQAIYGFRGATIDHLLNFSKQYPASQQLTLSNNYRSSATIVQAAAGLIAHNQDRFIQHSKAIQPAGSLITVIQPAAITATIEQLIGGSSHQQIDQHHQLGNVDQSYSFGDMAIIVRFNYLGRQLQKKLTAAGLPHQLVGETNFFERLEIRTILEVLEKNITTDSSLSQQLQQCVTAEQAHYSIVQQQRLEQLLTLAMSYNDLPADVAYQQLHDQAALSRNEDYWNQQRDVITIITAHAAKGLEWPVVFIAGVEAGVFPAEPTEAERRLFYVAMTRAQQQLYLVSKADRPSIFLSELPDACLQHQLDQGSKKTKPTKPQLRLL